MQNAPAIIQQTLPGLVQRAASQLASATTAAEVLEARDTARVAYDAAKSAARFVKAKKAHDDVLTAVYRAQADALEIEALAKRRLADEYDAAQDRGEVASQGKPSKAEGLATAADIGLSTRTFTKRARSGTPRKPTLVSSGGQSTSKSTPVKSRHEPRSSAPFVHPRRR
jgi:hypothetical protein